MKKLLCTFLTLIILLSTAVTTSANNSEHLFGDTNDDGVISITDATIIQMHLAQLYLMDDAVIPYADVNANGYVDIKDATLIQMYLARKIPDFPANSTEPVDEELEYYLAVEDEAILAAVFAIFKEKFQDVFTFED